jgi:hypothetical protein
MALQLDQGTQIFRSVSNKEFIATYSQTDKGMRIEVDPSQQPVDWGKHPTVFTTLSPWAMLCSTIVLGNSSKHSASGWHVCYIKANEKRIYLHKLRDITNKKLSEAPQEAKPEVKENEEMPPKKPLPKEPVPFAKSVLKSFPIIKKVYTESEKQPETLETDTQKLWKEVIEGKERFVCEQGFIFEIGMDGEPGEFVGLKKNKE